MNIPYQPNFQNLQGAAEGTDFDNMSDEDLQRLINDSHKAKTGRSGNIRPVPSPPPSGYRNLDAELAKLGVNNG